MRREDAKEIHRFIIDTVKKEKFAFVTDGKLDLSSSTVGQLLARKVIIVDTGGMYNSNNVEDALQEMVTVIETNGLYFNDGVSIKFEEDVGTDHTAAGILISKQAKDTFVFGEVGYVTSDFKLGKADANYNITMPACYMATETIASGTIGLFLIDGFARDNSWTLTSGVVYVSPTISGAITQTKPSVAGQQVQVVGIPIASNIIHFRPSFNVEVV